VVNDVMNTITSAKHGLRGALCLTPLAARPKGEMADYYRIASLTPRGVVYLLSWVLYWLDTHNQDFYRMGCDYW